MAFFGFSPPGLAQQQQQQWALPPYAFRHDGAEKEEDKNKDRQDKQEALQQIPPIPTLSSSKPEEGEERQFLGCPSETVTCLRWCPAGSQDQNILAATSWDGSLRLWDYDATVGESTPTMVWKPAGTPRLPLLSCDFFAKNPSYLVSGGCDGAVRLWNLERGHSIQTLQHAHGVRCCLTSDFHGSVVISGSWDHFVRIHDVREPQNAPGQPAIHLSRPILALAQSHHFVAVATSEKTVNIFDLRKQNSIAYTFTPPKTYLQIRCLRFLEYPTLSLALGTVGSNIAVLNLAHLSGNHHNACMTNPTPKHPLWRSHVHSTENEKMTYIYAVNDLDVHPTMNTIASAGSDGTINFFDLDKRQQTYGSPLPIPSFPRNQDPRFESITSCRFSPNKLLFAYARGCDYSRRRIEKSTDPEIQKLCLQRSSIVVRHLDKRDLVNEEDDE